MKTVDELVVELEELQPYFSRYLKVKQQLEDAATANERIAWKARSLALRAASFGPDGAWGPTGIFAPSGEWLDEATWMADPKWEAEAKKELGL